MGNNKQMIGPFELDSIVCTDAYKAIKLIPNNSVDMIYCDIPYLYQQGGGGSSELGKRIKNRAKKLELIGMTDGVDYVILDEFVRVMKKINCYIWCSKLQILDIMKFFVEKHNCYFEILTWNKTNPTPSTNNSWLPDIEYCLYFREKGVPLNDGYEYKSKFYVAPVNVSDKKKFKHMTIKPLPLVEKHILHASKEGDIVFDCFLGSGTTAVACKKNNRHFLGFEINEKYYKIAQNRLNNLDATGQYSMFTV